MRHFVIRNFEEAYEEYLVDILVSKKIKPICVLSDEVKRNLKKYGVKLPEKITEGLDRRANRVIKRVVPKNCFIDWTDDGLLYTSKNV